MIVIQRHPSRHSWSRPCSPSIKRTCFHVGCVVLRIARVLQHFLKHLRAVTLLFAPQRLQSQREKPHRQWEALSNQSVCRKRLRRGDGLVPAWLHAAADFTRLKVWTLPAHIISVLLCVPLSLWLFHFGYAWLRVGVSTTVCWISLPGSSASFSVLAVNSPMRTGCCSAGYRHFS